MAAPKGKEKKEILFNEAINEIAINGKSLLQAVKGKMTANTFYDLLKDEKKLQRYARATDDRADMMADEILSISDNVGHDLVILPDGREVVDNAVVQRDRLRVDSRKWLLAKLRPKKYGDQLDVTSGGEKIQQLPTINIMTKESAAD